MKNIVFIYPLILLGILLMITNSCKKKDDINNPAPTVQFPVLEKVTISNLTQTTASGSCNIISQGSSAVTESGLCWSTSQTPTISDNKTTDSTSIGSFTNTISGLTAFTTYYVRAYATNAEGTGYGIAISFTTYPGAGNTVADIDGNIYHMVVIGSQIWMVENLKTTRYCNGDPINNITDSIQWINLTTGAYCNYSNIETNADKFGRLYNWYAVTDSRKIAPDGWRVPNETDMHTLANYLGGDNFAGGKMKETGTINWLSPNFGATNETGFTALPSGVRYYHGAFVQIGNVNVLWSITDDNSSLAWCRLLTFEDPSFTLDRSTKTCGFSVRCIKD